MERIPEDHPPTRGTSLRKVIVDVAQGEGFLEAYGLVIVDQQEDAVVKEGIAGFFELKLPINLARGARAVEGVFGVEGLHQAAEAGAGGGEVVVLDLLVDGGAEEFADGEGFVEEVEGEGREDVAGGGLVMDGDGGHGGPPERGWGVKTL
jgi:hypothetical protein